MTINLLEEEAIRRLVPMNAAIDAVRRALIDVANNEFELPQRLTFGQSNALVMPLFHRPSRSVVTKSLSLDPQREPMITGTVTWAAAGERRTIVADAATVTAIRTGAIVGLAIDLLAQDDAHNLLVFGAGAQVRDLVRAVACVRPLRKVTIVSRTLQRATGTASSLADEFPLIAFNATISGRSELRDCDVICCATPSNSPLFSIKELPERVTVAAIGSYTPQMHELPQELLATSHPLYVDDIAACMAESGEVIRAIADGHMSTGDMIPLSHAIALTALRTDRSVFKSVGTAAQDWALMQVISEQLWKH